jgi:hypothetical protein
MKKYFVKKIWIMALFLLMPFSAFGQQMPVVNINWNSLNTTTTSVNLGAHVEVFPVCPGSFGWKIEYGFPGEYVSLTEPFDTFSNYNMTGGEPVGFIPPNGNFNSGQMNQGSSYHPVTGAPCQNPISFTGAVSNLFPAHTYYFKFWQCVVGNPNNCSADFDRVYIATTGSLTSGANITFGSSNDFPGEHVIYIAPIGISQNILNNMKVHIYVSDQDTNNMSLEELSNIALGGMHARMFANGNVSIHLPLTPGQTYYMRMMTDAYGVGGGHKLFVSDLSFVAPQNPGDNNGDPTGGNNGNNGNQSGSGNQPGFEQPSEYSSGLINCDETTIKCDFEKLLQLVNRVINFFIFVIALPIITLVFIYAGFLLITSGGNPSKKDDAKSIIGKAVTGLIVMLAAWLLIKTVLVVLGYSGPLIGVLGI